MPLHTINRSILIALHMLSSFLFQNKSSLPLHNSHPSKQKSSLPACVSQSTICDHGKSVRFMQSQVGLINWKHEMHMWVPPLETQIDSVSPFSWSSLVISPEICRKITNNIVNLFRDQCIEIEQTLPVLVSLVWLVCYCLKSEVWRQNG